MINKEDENESRRLIQCFLTQVISADEFCSGFTRFWMRFRDEQEKIKETWEKPYDRMLVDVYLRGEITKDEFAKRYRELWGLPPIMDFCEMIDSIHSLCSSYNPTPQHEWEVNDGQLRVEVQKALEKYETKVADS